MSLDLTLPTGATFTSNVSSPAACATAFPCTFGPMQPGDVVLVVTTIQVSATPANPFTVTATLTPSSSSVSDNLTSTSTQTVATGGDLQVSVTGPSPVSTGTTVVRTTTITNAGPGEAAGVSLNGTLSGPATNPPVFLANDGACSTAFPCSLNAIPAGQTVTISSVYSVPVGFQSGSTFTATVSSVTPDANLANNTATFAFSTTASSGCSTTGEPGTVFGLVGVALAAFLRRRRDTF